MPGTPIDGLDPVELTLATRLEVADFDETSPGTLSEFFPVVEIDDIHYSYNRGIDTLVDEAMYRAFDAESQIGRRPGTSEVSGKLLPISRKIPLSEYDRLRRNGNSDAIVDAIFADAARLGRGVFARLIRARASLLLTGKVQLNENGVVSTYNSGRHASLTVGAVSTLWSDYDDSTPISDVLAWKALIAGRTQGIQPNRLLVTETVMTHLQQVDEVRGAFVSVDSVGPRVTRDAVVDAFLQMAGVRLEVFVPPPGMTPTPWAENMVVLLRDDVPFGTTTLGTPLEATRPDYASLGNLPGVVAGGWEEDDPMTAWTHAVAIGLPLLGVPDLTLSAQVLA